MSSGEAHQQDRSVTKEKTESQPQRGTSQLHIALEQGDVSGTQCIDPLFEILVFYTIGTYVNRRTTVSVNLIAVIEKGGNADRQTLRQFRDIFRRNLPKPLSGCLDTRAEPLGELGSSLPNVDIGQTRCYFIPAFHGCLLV